jgi:hypothetical protein
MNMNMRPEHDRRRPGRDTPPPVFADVGALLARPDLWPAWLAEHPDRAETLAQAFSCVVRLESHTGWDNRQVLEELGCTIKTEKQLLSGDRLDRCHGYMKWVESLVCKLDLAVDKRLVVSSAARFFLSAGKDLAVCSSAMSSGEFPPLEYLRIGEVSQAWDLALSVLDSPDGIAARRAFDANPFMGHASPHISPKRLEMLGDPDAAGLLGSQTSARMTEHVESCRACEAALAELAEIAERVAVGHPVAV